MHKAEHVWRIHPFPAGQNDRHFSDDIYGYIFVNETLHFDKNCTENLFLRLQLKITEQRLR